VGSFVLAATREGASAGIAMDDMRPFFVRPSWAHTWFYLLVAVFGLYALNTALATWHSVSRKWRAGVRAPARYAPALFHVAFLLALAAHGVGGLWGEERGEAIIAEGPFRPLPDGREARLLSLAAEHMPNGMPKEVRAEVEVRDAAGRLERARVGYNEPLSAGLGADLHLLADQGRLPLARLSLAGQACEAPTGGGCTAAGVSLEVLNAEAPGTMGPRAVAQVVARPSLPGGRPQQLLLVEGRDAALADGRPLRLEAVEVRSAILVRSRAAPGNPWAFASAVTIGLGVLLLWRRFLPRAPTPAPEPEEPGSSDRPGV
jgi:hypothetical protein